MIIIDNKYTLKDFGMIALKSHSNPATPRFDNNVIDIPKKLGVYDMGTDVKERVISIQVAMIEYDRAKKQQKINDLISLLMDQYAKPRDIKLSFVYEPEKYYRVKLSSQVIPERLYNASTFDLSFIAHDPFKYAPATYYDPGFTPRYDTNAYYDTNLEYKNQTGVEFDNPRTYAGVFNYSHYATPFSFVIEGYVHKPKITNLTSGQTARINVTVQKGERLYFDSKNKTVWLTKAESDAYFWLTPVFFMKDYDEWDKINRYNDMIGDFIDLVSGGNHLLFEGGNPDASITFNWEHRFL